MSIHQIHFGRKFYLDNQKGYWNSTDSPRIFAHRWVWINYNGPIPKGCHIHHRDRDKGNNDINNLELMSRSAHLRLHSKDESRIKHAREMAEKYRPLTTKWHASPEGKAWHKFHALKCKFGKNDPVLYKCDTCDKNFKSSKLSNTRFCSNACKSKWRRDAGLDDVERICQLCLKIFMTNKYKKTKFCSHSCCCKNRWISIR